MYTSSLVVGCVCEQRYLFARVPSFPYIYIYVCVCVCVCTRNISPCIMICDMMRASEIECITRREKRSCASEMDTWQCTCEWIAVCPYM
jgi:hypothetical protein